MSSAGRNVAHRFGRAAPSTAAGRIFPRVRHGAVRSKASGNTSAMRSLHANRNQASLTTRGSLHRALARGYRQPPRQNESIQDQPSHQPIHWTPPLFPCRELPNWGVNERARCPKLGQNKVYRFDRSLIMLGCPEQDPSPRAPLCRVPCCEAAVAGTPGFSGFSMIRLRCG